MSALVPYKRIDLAIAACEQMGVPLRIVGDGQERTRLSTMAGPSVTFLGWREKEQIRDEYHRAAAVIMPGEEDFGIVPVEAQACGCPVVALGRGGAVETVIDGETGVLFDEPTVDSLTAALQRFRTITFDRAVLRRRAKAFSRERFRAQMRATIDATLAAPPGTRW